MRRQPPRRIEGAREEVVIVSGNEATLVGLNGYLRTRELTVRCARDLVGWKRLRSKSTVAVVLFPDDYDAVKVESLLTDVVAQDRIALIMVTAHPQHYRGLIRDEDAPVVIVPRPAWGWRIRDAIRDYRRDP